MVEIVTTWWCGMGHSFTWGDEDWHAEASQGRMPEGDLIPMYCQADDENGDPCMDSSSLIPD